MEGFDGAIVFDFQPVSLKTSRYKSDGHCIIGQEFPREFQPTLTGVDRNRDSTDPGCPSGVKPEKLFTKDLAKDRSLPTKLPTSGGPRT
jgi:hypothetical protein